MIIIVAINNNNGIGYQGQIPWICKNDLQFFMKTTKNHITHPNVVIMGRKTFESIGSKPLRDRINIIISSKPIDGILRAPSLKEALEMSKKINHEKIFVCGGQHIYEEAVKMDECREALISKIDNNCKCDVFFPYDYVREHYEFHSLKLLGQGVAVEKYVKDFDEYIENERNMEFDDVVYV